MLSPWVARTSPNLKADSRYSGCAVRLDAQYTQTARAGCNSLVVLMRQSSHDAEDLANQRRPTIDQARIQLQQIGTRTARFSGLSRRKNPTDADDREIGSHGRSQ